MNKKFTEKENGQNTQKKKSSNSQVIKEIQN